jgi:hypothetical protein
MSAALPDADRAACFLLEHARKRVGSRWHQGLWSPPLAARALAESVDVIARHRVWRVERAVARGIVAWASGEREVQLRTDIPSFRELLALQAHGRRAVSLLPEGVPTAPHPDALAFALHDLCHLEKFVDPEHHAGQVGFFAMAHTALDSAAFRELDARFDGAWRADVEHVVADMNGCAIFLFAALKMKLKMASRREHARLTGAPLPSGGALSEAEHRWYEAALELLLDAFDLHGADRVAARAVSTRRGEPEQAAHLLALFQGREARAGAGPTMLD